LDHVRSHAFVLMALLLEGCATGPWYREYGFSSEQELRQPSAVPGLVRALQSGDVATAEEAGRALARLGAPAVPPLTAELQRGSQIAAWALGEMGPAAKDAVPALIAALGDKEKHMRAAALRALGKIGPSARPAVPALLLVLQNEHSHDVRLLVPPTLASIGDGGPEVLSALQRAGSDHSLRTRHAARDALAKLRLAAMAPRPAGKPGAIIAVFDVQDASGQLGATSVDQLTEYLAAQLAAGGLRVVPRAQLRARLIEEKKGSLRSCVDESCQIELGKAVAAQKTVATKILRVDRQCAITAMLYDLKTEATERAATVEVECSERALLGGLRQLAQKLSPTGG
jgi:hypothetical protein